MRSLFTQRLKAKLAVILEVRLGEMIWIDFLRTQSNRELQWQAATPLRKLVRERVYHRSRSISGTHSLFKVD
jgi:hypothetical protein